MKMTKLEMWEDLKKDNELNGWIKPELFESAKGGVEGFITFKLCGFNTIWSSFNVVISCIQNCNGVYHVSAHARNL